MLLGRGRWWTAVAGLALVFPAGLADSGAGLWQKAVQWAERARETLPGLIELRAEMMDGDGDLEGVQESTIKLKAGASGEVESELVRVLEDGKDVTAKAREEEAKRRREKQKKGKAAGEQSVGIQIGESPFHPASQAQVIARATGQRRTLRGKACLEFQVTWKKEKETEKGTAWLDEQTGAPVEYTFSPDPLPRHARRVLTTWRYEDAGPLGWRPVEMNVEGEGGFLFIRKKFRMRTTFGEFWRNPFLSKKP